MMSEHERIRRFGAGLAVHEQGLTEEMASHVEQLAEELEASGMTPEEARREAARRFGDAGAYRRACRSIDARDRTLRRWRRGLEGFLHDQLSAARGLRTHPIYAITVVLTLALAIGMCTAIFSVVDAVILEPLDLPAPDRLMMITETERESGGTNSATPANFVDWREQAKSFSGVAAIDRARPTLGDADEPVRIAAAAVTEDFFSLIGIAPQHGRLFDHDEHTTPGTRVAILGDGLFRRRFGGDPAVVGRDIVLDGAKVRVIGIMPARFDVPLETDLWLPLVFDFDVAGARGAHYLSVIGRLEDSVDRATAAAEMDAIARRLEAAYPRTNTNAGIALMPLQETQTGSVRSVLLTLIAAVAVVLLIACANVAGLALARVVDRDREMALRAALGAGRGRLVRHLLGEAALLALAGGVGGLLLAWLATDLLVARLPFQLPRLEQVGINGRILLFTWLVTLVCTLLVGLAPALRLARVPVEAALRDRSAAVLGGARRLRLRQGLVAVELALALVLLSACGLLVRSLGQLIEVDLGFDSAGVLTFRLDLAESTYPQDRQAAFFEQLLERVAALPGVRSAAVVPWLPLTPGWMFSFQIIGEPPAPPEVRQGANLRMISADYFETLGIPQLRGRGFNSRDDAASQPVIVVNQALVDRYFAGRDPLGRELELGYGRSGTPKVQRRIVGVVGNVRHFGPQGPALPTVYSPHTQIPFGDMSVALRTDGDPMSLARAARDVVHELDPAIAVDRLQTLEDRYGEILAPRRFVPAMLGAFAVLALVLAALGLYGVMAQLVAARTAELGVRRALGATSASMVWLVLGRALALVCLGVVFGLAGAWASSRLIAGLLFGVEPGDPLTLLSVSALLAVVALAACTLPALRASRIDPVRTLRQL